MPTFTALTTLTEKAPAAQLGLLLEQLDPAPYGIGVFEVEDGSGIWEVGAYFMDEPDSITLDLLGATVNAKPFVISEVPDKDWVAEVRRELAPVVAGRFFVYGAHDADKLPADAIGLKIEAAMAFGTGHHGTTQGCLTAIDQLHSSGFNAKNTIDVGCGTAVLAMAASHLWDGQHLASDIDTIAVETARANLKTNGLADKVEVIECAGFDHPDITERSPYDLIMANILKGPLVELAPKMADYAAPGGHVILSGILNTQAEEVIEAYAAYNLSLIDHIKIGDWSTLTLRKAAS
ncbi:MAG: 50S ribosomal protein L11 methyltransferase [Pseudomonadota bacterium]